MSMDLEERLATLEHRCATLEEQVLALSAELARARVGGFRAIRDARTCPACSGRMFVHARQATQATHTSVIPLGITHEWKWTGPIAHGVMEAFACRGCGLVELHVVDFADVVVDGVKVVAVDPEPDGPREGPFR